MVRASHRRRRQAVGTVGTRSATSGWYIGDGCQRFFYLSDRRVDMFTVGGCNVYPAEVEAALAAHPHVLSCLVVGVPDDDLGQVPTRWCRPVHRSAGRAIPG